MINAIKTKQGKRRENTNMIIGDFLKAFLRRLNLSNDVITCTIKMGEVTNPLKWQIVMRVFKNEVDTPRTEVQERTLKEMRISNAAVTV